MASTQKAVDRNSREEWEKYFTTGWRENNGRRQTRLFARYFLETVNLPPSANTLLDVGCAMGDALPEFHRKYNNLRLSGCDVSDTAIKVAQLDYGAIATFTTGGFHDICGHYDIIYCSNTLEHFSNYVELAAHLLDHCKVLYVMVPYREYRRGRDIAPDDKEWHQATFYEDSFDELKKRHSLRSCRTWIIRTPIAWDDTYTSRLIRYARRIFSQKTSPAQQIIYEFAARDVS